MSLIEPINIPPTASIEELTQTLNNALGKLTDQLNNRKQTADLDANNHRLVNVAWPNQLHDAVNVEYLKNLTSKTRTPRTTKGNTTSGGYDKATFGIAIDSDLFVANDTNPWYICAATLRLLWVAAVSKTPADVNIAFRFNKNPADPQDPQTNESILQANFTIIPSTLVHTWDTFDIVDFAAKDIITADTINVGTSTAGGDVVFVFKFEVVNNDVGTINHYYTP